jgi:hypothetical protein
MAYGATPILERSPPVRVISPVEKGALSSMVV